MIKQRVISSVMASIVFVAALCTAIDVCAQDREGDVPRTRVDTLGQDSMRVETGRRSEIDTIVSYHARSIVNDIVGRRLLLYGDAEVVYGDQRLTGHYIELDFNGSTLYARAFYDSTTGQFSEVPVFRDGSQEVTANEIKYNFKTKRAVLTAAESQFQSGFYFAEKTYRIAPNTVYIQDGRYTTCDAPHPHFYFSAPEMKVVENDKVFADQVTLNVADVPVFFIPFGVFFASRSGKQSGIILPDLPPTVDATRGVVFRGLGFFWAGNDYVDALATTDLYMKGGVTVRGTLRGRVNSIQLERSQLDLTWALSRTDPDNPFDESWIVNYSHNQKIGRVSSVSGNINFTTQNAIRNSTNVGDRTALGSDITRQEVASNISFTTTLWGLGITTGYRRSQNIVNNELTQSIPLSINLPNYTPFSDSKYESFPLRSLSLGYSTNVQLEGVRLGPLPPDSTTFKTEDVRFGVTHRPTISLPVRFDYLTFTPSVNYTESWFRRRIVKENDGTSVVSRFEGGFRRASSYAFGLSASTRFYGIVQPGILGITALRHVVTPTVSLSYTPDFGRPEYGYVDSVFDPGLNRMVAYSIFEGDVSAASIPPTFGSQTVAFSLNQTFQAKIAQGDTLPDRKVDLLSLTTSVNYNAAAPGNIRWSPISLSASTNLGQIGNLTASGSFDIYDYDTLGVRKPELLARNGRGLVRTTSFSVSVSTSFSDQGFSAGLLPTPVTTDTSKVRRSRFDFSQIPFDDNEFFGETVRGRSNFILPWRIGFTTTWNYSPRFSATKPVGYSPHSLNIITNLELSLTPTVRLSSGGTYNLDAGKFLVPSISLTKDLHCWSLSFNWYPPGGTSSGYYFRLGLNAAELQDVKIERQE